MKGIDNYTMFLFTTIGMAFIAGVFGSGLQLLPNSEVQVHYAGEMAFIACAASGGNVQRVMWTTPEGTPITAYMGSPPSYDQSRIHVVDGQSGQKGVDLVFSPVTRKDQGSYTCSANVDGKEVQASFKLIVHKRVDFADTPKSQFLEEGRDSVLKCNVDGYPVPKIQWRNGATGRPMTEPKYTKHPDHYSWIIVNNVTRKDSGSYLCLSSQATERAASMKTFQVDVKVNHEPEPFPFHVNESFSYVNGVVNLTCAAEAEPRANFTWIKDGLDIEESDTLRFYQDDHVSVLQIEVEDDSAFGDYICKAENHLGTLERVVTLEKGEKPATPRLKVLKTTENSFTLSLEPQKVQPKMAVIAFRIEYKRRGQEWNQARIIDFKQGQIYVIGKLESDKLYGIRASAKNPAGFSDPSKEIMERTQKVVASKGHLSSASSLLVSITTVTFLSQLILNNGIFLAALRLFCI